MIKKIFIFCLLFNMICSNNLFSQKYRELFDQLDSQDPGLTSLYSNINRDLNGYSTQLLESYLNMFRATDDIRYLNKFVITAKRVQDRRDDNITSAVVLGLPASRDGCTLNSTTEIWASRAWSVYDGNRLDDGCFLTQTFKEAAEICIPMADFILMLRTDYSYLLSNPLPNEVNSLTASIHNYGSVTPVLTYEDFADWLELRIHETIDWFDESWVESCQDDVVFCLLNTEQNCCNQPANTASGYSYYQFTEHNTGGINQQLYMGTLLVYMYQISVIKGTSGINPNLQYRFRARNMLYDFMAHINDSWGIIGGSRPVIPGTGGETCYIWCHKYDCGGDLWEDVSHAIIDLKFAHVCHKFNIPNIVGGFITASDMHNLSNTFAYKIVSSPLDMHKNVTGGDNNCDQCDPDVSPSSYGFMTAQYAFLSEYNPKIYQIISDFYAPDNIMNYDISGGVAVLGYSNLALYENIFNPIAVKRSVPVASGIDFKYTGACGDFIDGDGNNVFVSSKVYTSSGFPITQIEEQYLDNNNNIVVLNTFARTNEEIGLLSKGDILPTISGDEFVGIDARNDQFELFRVQSASLNSFFQTPFSSLGINLSDVKGTVVANFHPVIFGDEILVNAVVAGSPVFKMFHFDGTTLIEIPTTSNTSSLSSIDGLCSGKFDASGENQIAVYENSTNKIEIYNFDGDDEFLLVSSGTISTPGEIWKGITSGDFDGDGIDEIMLYQENAITGRFEIFRLTTSGIELKALEYFPNNQENGIMCSMNLSNYPKSEALVTFRSYDGQVNIFNMEGLCPGLNLNSQTINENTSIDNPYEGAPLNDYSIDYHVNGTLVAGNNFNVLAPSIVDMTSGKEIIFKPGFTAVAGSNLHAYIEPALECSPSTFRKNTPISGENPPQFISQPEKIKTTRNSNISIIPNPNNGTFLISVTRNNNPVSIKEIKVYDIMGKVIWETGASSSNMFAVDITPYASGIYYAKCINEFDEMEMKKLIKQ